ncbi:long-chain fatty acid--CoA ligase [Nocardioides sp. AN3]
MNTARALWASAQRHRDRPALRTAEGTWSYRSVAEASAAFADRLRKSGVRPGDRVLLVAPTSPEFVVAYFGILAAGATAVTVNPACTESEMSYFLDDSGSSMAVVWPEGAEAACRAALARGLPAWVLRPDVLAAAAVRAEPEPRADDDVAVLLYTSGTTGRPKGAELTHANLTASAAAFVELLDLGDDARLGTALPLFHVFGQVAVLGCALQQGATLSLLHPFSGDGLVRLAGEHELTVLYGVPTMWNDMLQTRRLAQRETPHLRLAISGGAALPAEVARRLLDRFGCTVLDGYGMSESTGAGTMARPQAFKKEGSVGRSLPGLEVRVVDESGSPMPVGATGEVVIRGPVVMRGYWNRPDATAETLRDGWLHTGDLGRQDEEGDLWIVGRSKELVIRGGYNVYPREIEELLYQHPAVREAAVIGVPDDRLGEEVAAVVAFREGQTASGAELREWLSLRLAPYKLPRIYAALDALPKGSTGKIQKRALDPAAIRAAGDRAGGRSHSA